MALTIVGLGPGAADDITRRAWAELERAETVYLRTKHHPCVPHLPDGPAYHTFDSAYETHDAFEDVYTHITETLLKTAAERDVVYAVPGDPTIAESTVSRLRAGAAEANISLTIHSGVSFIEPTCAALGIDALDGLQLVDALSVAAAHHPPLNPETPALLAQVYSREVASHVKLTLMNQYRDDFPVVLVHSAGADGVVERVPLYEIDRSEQINHLTSLYVPAVGERVSFEAAQDVIAHLRAPEGCPWDREQTHESLRPYLMEEAYEVLDALNRGDMDNLMEELGDLLLQIILHTQIATENGDFQMTDVIHNINEKMVRRHPHVWGDRTADDADEVVKNWEQIKKEEKAANGEPAHDFVSALDGVPESFSALMRAEELSKRASKVGFDYDNIEDVKKKLFEEIEELDEATNDAHLLSEAGDVLFAAVDILRWLKIAPEVALQSTNSKFAGRFAHVERRVFDEGKQIRDFSLEELDVFWEEAKEKGL